ncbi:2-hydroxyacyl-CoA dehydratase [Candidatus Woesearchaeota archaeon]|jgi:benzoyl-CoA reductase/2-hydroxyglutaryl-CoA dehydratase subunit BcrC/BadD/HgdB|nr:2-hydroxyacyl-CoA dehydratase [Candidatus Woesearchaeota archaeon]MBT4368209.1 2-hydroxyacyl-CoA dehydratase [Candidatus Woesearchaeota archaeon]MBT4712698.1 2-hydroxyacyl-CoA dehydratase [Candidatus Woesearchaeota archaeon]MBT6639610.1 2-hydroxyacyl-CoA dehydratase [Candidatus Woesearchaeota archaeon]MBT7133782.1 2-hydroxyacyl-CoA dehydratase [Candidatus Woesearchaeota archaeon]
MDLAKSYANSIKKKQNPEKVLSMIKTGLKLQCFKLKKFPDKKIPKSLQYLQYIGTKFILKSLSDPSRTVFVNLLAPVEILHALDLHPLFVEGFSSFLGGFQIEDHYIDHAEKTGVSETLCSYHKAFLGAIEKEILPKPLLAATTSAICDANISSFRHTAEKYNLPLYVFDLPHEYSRKNEEYVVSQLKEFIALLEKSTNKKLDLSKLKDVLQIENESKKYFKLFLKELKTKYFPNTLTAEMFKFMISHAFIGKKETLKFYKMMAEDIKSFPESTGKRIMWSHVLPYYQKDLKEFFNLNEEHQLLVDDFTYDYLDELDVENPLNSLAKKMLLNMFNGDYERRVKTITTLSKYLNADALINFCHWGCKQSMGGISLLRDSLEKNNIKFLSIDGDGADRRNTQSHQLKTRVEAFLEMLK